MNFCNDSHIWWNVGVGEHKIGQVDMKNGNLLVIEVDMWYLASFMLVVTDLLSAEYMATWY